MTINLDHSDLVSLVNGIEPPDYKLMGYWLVANCGSYNDLSGWRWNKKSLEQLSDEALYRLYRICKNNDSTIK